jgi:predicted HAD superfamily Cof-like phosphohydrolase
VVTIIEGQELVKKLELEKGFSRSLPNKTIRLLEEVTEIIEEVYGKSHVSIDILHQIASVLKSSPPRSKYNVKRLSIEYIDALHFIFSGLDILGVDGDKIFMQKYRKNIGRQVGQGLDRFVKKEAS